MRTKLYPHNQVAYDKVVAALQAEGSRTCVVHPTGTGKSYLIAAVSEQYERVLVLGPNVFVLDQVADVMPWRTSGVDYRTYAWLTVNVVNIIERYDLIVLDEFHRTGAPEWSAAVSLLIESQPKARVLGTSATPVRYLDGERDMADELFHGSVASQMSIAQAWAQQVLPVPRYVSGLFRWDKTAATAEERIRRSPRLTDKEKRQRIFKISNARLEWERSYGMPAILKRHLPKDTRRIIVFCAHIETMDDMSRQVEGWLREAGFRVAGTCILHSDMTDRQQRDAMREFGSDEGQGVRLMFSINMLNEGVHIPNVNAVLMLRTTASRIIYMQQMGRCLTAANGRDPLVLDMVDNITTTTAIRGLAADFDALEMQLAVGEGREPRRFEVVDYTMDVRELVERLVPPSFRELADSIDEVRRFFDTEQRPPSQSRNSSEQERRTAQLWMYLKKQHPADATVMELYQRERTWYDTKIDRYMDEIDAFAAEHGRTPTHSQKRDGRLGDLWHQLKNNYPDHPRVRATWQRYSYENLCREKMLQTVAEVTAHCQQYGHQPRSNENSKLYGRWFAVRKSYPDAPEVLAVRSQWPEYNWAQQAVLRTIREVRAYREKHGRYPESRERIGAKMASAIKRHKEMPEVLQLQADVEADRRQQADAAMLERVRERAKTVTDFYAAYGRMPVNHRSPEESRLHQRMQDLLRCHPTVPEVQHIAALRAPVQ